jgi:tellurite methyltransferase
MGPEHEAPGTNRWDERYREGDWVDARGPADIVRTALPWIEETAAEGGPGRALDVACGAGRNAVFLAERGWKVLGFDRSVEGLRILSRRGAERDLPIVPVLADAAEFAVRPGSVDLVVNTHFLLREAFPLLRSALRPGGLLVFETFSVVELEELGGDIRRAFAVERGELLRAFAGFQVLLHEEGVFEREEGDRGLARFVGRKPAVRPWNGA